MTDSLAIGFLVAWLIGVLFFLTRAMNLYRLILNNIVPGKTYAEVARLPNLIMNRRYYLAAPEIGPQYLTELGQRCQRAAMTNGVGLVVWTLVGLIAIVCYFSL